MCRIDRCRMDNQCNIEESGDRPFWGKYEFVLKYFEDTNRDGRSPAGNETFWREM